MVCIVCTSTVINSICYIRRFQLATLQKHFARPACIFVGWRRIATTYVYKTLVRIQSSHRLSSLVGKLRLGRATTRVGWRGARNVARMLHAGKWWVSRLGWTSACERTNGQVRPDKVTNRNVPVPTGSLACDERAQEVAWASEVM
jgi:hypothetical protein